MTSKSLEEELPHWASQYGSHLDTITAAQVADGGYRDVAGALEALAPGLYVSSKTGPFDYAHISLQGSRTSDVLWLVDGVRINNRLYAGTTPLDTLPASMIERIEILDGGQALFYGTQAVAGAINIVTKAFSDHSSGSVSLGADTHRGVRIDGVLRNAVGNNRFVAYASHDESSGVRPFPTEEFQPSGTDRYRYYHVTTAGVKYGYDFGDALALSTSYQHTGATLDYAQPMLTASAFNERKEDLLSARLDYTPGEEFNLYVKGYYHWWLSHYTEFDNVIGSPGVYETVADHEFWGFRDYGVNLLAKLAVQRGFEYIVGYDFQSYSGRDAVLVIEPRTEHASAFFGQVRTTPDLIPNARLAAGVRYNTPSVGQSATVWNVGGQYDLSRSLFLKANMGSAFRLPTAEELFANDPQDERGNPHLRPESSTNVNASLGGTVAVTGSPLKWEVIAFYRSIKNLIDYQDFDAVTNQDVFGNVSGRVVTRGVEVVLNCSVTAEWSANLNGTYTRTRQDQSNLQFRRIPVTQVKAGLDYHPMRVPVGIGVNLVRLGNLDDEPLGGGNGRFGYGNYTIVDLNGRVFLDSSRHHRVNLQLNNVFDKRYYAALGFGVTDITGDPYVVHDRGLSRTFSANYTYSY